MNTIPKIVVWTVCAVALTACAVPAGNPHAAPSATSSARSVQTDKASDAAMAALCDKVRNSNDPKLKAAMGQSCAENGY